MDRQMSEMDALFEYWSDPDYIVVPADQRERIIDWLAHQDPDTWHRVVQTWNYDHDTRVLNWILTQERCDRGTAARVFLVEGAGHWLSDVFGGRDEANNDLHVCKTVLKNWDRYLTGTLKHHYKIPEQVSALLEANPDHQLLVDPVFRAILSYEGTRDAESIYESQDGKIVVAFDHWLKNNGIQVTSK